MIVNWRVFFDLWITKICGNKKPLKQPYDDWFICMQEAYKEGYKQGHYEASIKC